MTAASRSPLPGAGRRRSLLRAPRRARPAAVVAALLLAATLGCEDGAPADPVGEELDLSAYVAIGNSLTAGFMNGALGLEGQSCSYPRLLAGQAGVSGHLTIGKGATIAAQAGVFGDVPAGEKWSGYPARPHREALRATGALFKLPELLKRMEQLLGEKTPR